MRKFVLGCQKVNMKTYITIYKLKPHLSDRLLYAFHYYTILVYVLYYTKLLCPVLHSALHCKPITDVLCIVVYSGSAV